MTPNVRQSFEVMDLSWLGLKFDLGAYNDFTPPASKLGRSIANPLRCALMGALGLAPTMGSCRLAVAGYSSRRMRAGSMVIMARAGIRQASVATHVRAAATAAKVS